MKKFVIIILFIVFSGVLISEEVVEGIKWNMSKSEVKKVLKTNNLGKETLNELSYKNIVITDNRLDLNGIADVVFFTFEDDKLVSIKPVFTKPKDKNYDNDFVEIILNCAMDEGAQRLYAQPKIGIVNIKYNYACGLEKTDELLMLLLAYKR